MPQGLSRAVSFQQFAANVGHAVHKGTAAIQELPNAAIDRFESFADRIDRHANKLNKWAEHNRLGRVFQFKERNAQLTTELRAGVLTFLMVAYSLALIPNILATTGGTCDPKVVCEAASYEAYGNECLADPDDPGADNCMNALKMNLVTATAASSLIASFIAGYFANMPLAIAPSLGINVYFTYQVVGRFGAGSLSFEQGMAIIFVEGWLFMILSITGVRGHVIRYMPRSIAYAASVGIGLLLAFTGLKSLDAIGFDPWTLVSLSGCTNDKRTYVYFFDTPNATLTSEGTEAAIFGCSGDEFRSPTLWLGIAGGILSSFMLILGVKAPIFIGVAFVTIISWIPGHGASYLGAGSPIPGGQQRLNVFKKVVAAPTLSMTGLAWDWSAFENGNGWLVLFTLLYIDLLDCTGTLISMAHLLNQYLPGFLNDKQEFHGQMWAFSADGTGIITGSMMGMTPLGVYLESAAGIEEGGRTGVVGIVVAFFFLLSLFFAPIFASIPPYATGPALVLIGILLMKNMRAIDWDNPAKSIPAILTMVAMPFTNSVAYGVIAGVFSYLLLHAPFWLLRRYRIMMGKLPTVSESDTDDDEHRFAERRRRAGLGASKIFGNDIPNLGSMRELSSLESSRNPSLRGANEYATFMAGGNGSQSDHLRRLSGSASFFPGSTNNSVRGGNLMRKSTSTPIVRGTMGRTASLASLHSAAESDLMAAAAALPPARPPWSPRQASQGFLRNSIRPLEKKNGLFKKTLLRRTKSHGHVADNKRQEQNEETPQPPVFGGFSGAGGFVLFPDVPLETTDTPAMEFRLFPEIKDLEENAADVENHMDPESLVLGTQVEDTMMMNRKTSLPMPTTEAYEDHVPDHEELQRVVVIPASSPPLEEEVLSPLPFDTTAAAAVQETQSQAPLAESQVHESPFVQTESVEESDRGAGVIHGTFEQPPRQGESARRRSATLNSTRSSEVRDSGIHQPDDDKIL